MPGASATKKKSTGLSIRGCSSVIPSEPATLQVIQEIPTMMFLFLYRDSTDPSEKPSPADMQAGYMKWKGWMEKYAKEIIEQPPARSGPKPGGARAVCKAGAVTDGPYAEGKEVVGGWSFIQAESLAHAAEIAKEVPMFASVEIVEIATF
jgi:hypothetical protein